MVLASALLALLAACGGGGEDGVTAREQPQAETTALAPAPLTGAIYTTDVTCGDTNQNVFYANKPAVYLNGGPAGGGSGLPPGSYYVRVTDPSGATVLGDSLTQAVTVGADGKFEQCYQLTAILYTASSGFTALGYDDTPNNGGEYKVWVSTVSTFDNSDTKTDNFKVRKSDVPPPPGNLGWVKVIKFYDANLNGVKDAGEVELSGWKVEVLNLVDPFASPGIDYTEWLIQTNTFLGDPPVRVSLQGTEFMPIELNWYTTTPGPLTVQVPTTPDVADAAVMAFGNVCTGAGGGLTLGFWSNKNGQALFGADDLAALVGLNLRNAAGLHFDPSSYTAYRTWSLNATATNMAYMLSAQLAAMKLNVFNGKVSGGAMIYAPGTMSANALGFASVSGVMDEANASLGTDGYTVASGATRTYQEALKNALDNANNNKTFVQAAPCAYTFAN
jgi:hypothetical protein